MNSSKPTPERDETAARPKSWYVDERGEVQGRIVLKPADRYVEFVDVTQVVAPTTSPVPNA
jgi:hypothetical protein